MLFRLRMKPGLQNGLMTVLTVTLRLQTTQELLKKTNLTAWQPPTVPIMPYEFSSFTQGPIRIMVGQERIGWIVSVNDIELSSDLGQHEHFSSSGGQGLRRNCL